MKEGPGGDLPPGIDTPGKRALYNNLSNDDQRAIDVHAAILAVRKANWRGNPAKENEIKGAIYGVVNDTAEVERIFAVVLQQDEF